MKYSEILKLRKTLRKSTLLFITDRCPVECEHCSVSSTKNSKTIEDFAKFKLLLDEIVDDNQIEVVGISGGEPFSEKKGLTMAIDALYSAGKKIILYTSGFWGAKNSPNWINQILSKCNTIVLSTDSFHESKIDKVHFMNSLRLIKNLKVWLIIQVLDYKQMVNIAKNMVMDVFGSDWDKDCEVVKIPLLNYGRGEIFTNLNSDRYADSFGICELIKSPVIRYDGVVSICCNESVIMGKGPNNLRNTIVKKGDFKKILDSFYNNYLNRVMLNCSLSEIAKLPQFNFLRSNKKYNNICEVCWELHETITRKHSLNLQPSLLQQKR